MGELEGVLEVPLGELVEEEVLAGVVVDPEVELVLEEDVDVVLEELVPELDFFASRESFR